MKSSPFFIFVVLFFVLRATNALNDNRGKPYIVYMGELRQNSISVLDEHHNILTQAIGDEIVARKSKLHSYRKSFSGFVANLLPYEARRLSQMEGVVSVFPNKVSKLLTTRSWDFLGMPTTVKRNQKVESDMVIGLLDTGIWVDHPSFNDDGFGPPAAKWKGKCSTGANFTKCNNKVVGAQYFNVDGDAPFDQISPVDFDGHGTHIASTAAGRVVEGASLYGVGKGTARGGVPLARVASYKVCWGQGCQDMDVLAGFDAAIADGVDMISISVGGHPRQFFEDPIAIGAFHAMKKGILTSAAAGNDGPYFGTIQNVSPWIFTVGASAIDRQFESDVKLGNGHTISGISINTFQLGKMYPLISGSLALDKNASFPGNASACDYGSLSQKLVQGKIVYCMSSASQDYTVKWIHGVGVIASDQPSDVALPTILPSTIVNIQEGAKVDHYINTTKNPTAQIFQSRAVNITAPFVPEFSGRGPNPISLNILKPDISAPGLSILAGYTPLTTMTGQMDDNRVVKYNIESGTSMSTPHAAGAAAYVKTFHPDWSPAAVKSALMTTARAMRINPKGSYLASGAGLMRPTKAVNPGLVYDIDVNNYISYLCKEGFNNSTLAALTGNKNSQCKNYPSAQGADGLNYPSMHLQLTSPNVSTFSAVFYRTVTYVGDGAASFKANVKAPPGVTISVAPNMLSFTKAKETMSFKVTVQGKFADKNLWYRAGQLVWRDPKYYCVKSPILVYRPPVYQ